LPAIQDASQDLSRIGDVLEEAMLAAALPTTVLPRAGADEVSLAISKLFEGHAQGFQVLAAGAQRLHQEFTQTLAESARVYQETEQASQVSLVMGGTGEPLWSPQQLSAIETIYHLPNAVNLDTPEDLWPLAGKLTFDQSVSQGQQILNTAI